MRLSPLTVPLFIVAGGGGSIGWALASHTPWLYDWGWAEGVLVGLVMMAWGWSMAARDNPSD